MVVLDVERSLYFGLSDVGAEVWNRVQDEVTVVAGLKHELLAHYSVPAAQIERDLLTLLTRLHAQGLLLVDPAEAELDQLRSESSRGDQSQNSASEQDVQGAIKQIRALREEERLRNTGSRWVRPPADWWMLLRAMVLTVLIRGALSVWSLKKVTQALKRIARGLPNAGTATLSYRKRAAWAANAVGHRFLPNRPCLTQALVLQYLLLRRGDESAELHIGVAKGQEGELLAHAWIERNGRVLIGGTASPHKYQPLDGVAQKVAAP